MKRRALFLTIFLIGISNLMAKEGLVKKNELMMDVVGEATNTEKQPVVAIAYALGKGGSTTDLPGFVKPQMVERLAEQVLPPLPGPLEATEEIPSPENYYNGELKLNKVEVKCNIYGNQTDCLHVSNCGWCGSLGSCIAGNNMGPLEPCLKSSFIFAPPVASLIPMNRYIKENMGGVQLSVISK